MDLFTKIMFAQLFLCMMPFGAQCGILKLSSSGVAINSLLHPQCTNLFFGLSHGDIKVVMDSQHGFNIVLDPAKIFTFFAILPMLDKGCYTAITYASLEPILQGSVWFALFRRVVILLAPAEGTQLIQMQQEFKPTYSSLSYDEVFYMEMQKENFTAGRMTLLCPSGSNRNLTETLANLWNSETLQWLKKQQRHYKQIDCNDGRGTLHGTMLDVAYTLIEPYTLLENYNEDKVEDKAYRQNLKPNSGSSHALMQVMEKKFGFTANYKYHVAYITIYEKNNTAPGLLEEVAMQNLPLGTDCPINTGFGEYIDYSHYCYHTDYVFAMPLPERLPPKFNIMYPFQNSLWVALGITVLSMSIVFVLFARITEAPNYLNVVSESIGVLFQEYGHTIVTINSYKLKTYGALRFLWVIVAFILVLSYSGNLKASLIIVEFESRVETLDEMLEHNTTLITVNEAAGYLGETESELDQRIYARMTRDNASIPMRGQHGEKILKLALNTGSAMYYPDTFIRWKRSLFYRQSKRFPLYIIRQKWEVVYHGMIYPKGSYLVELMNPVVRATHDYGIVVKVFRDLIPTDYDEDEVKQEEETEGKLTLVHFYILFYFLFGSLLTATATLLAECLWSNLVMCKKPDIPAQLVTN